MNRKTIDKERAVQLRKEGKTYSEILALVPVAKSTLSIWLREIGIAKRQTQKFTERRILAQKRGAQSRRSQRLMATREIFLKTSSEVGRISKRELWLIGTILYWAEGSKQKDWNVSQSLQFTNSDPFMIKLYLKWLYECLNLKPKDIKANLFLHEKSTNRLDEIINYWNEVAGLRGLFSDKVFLKRNKPTGRRRNLNENYRGTVRIYVKKSTNLNRMVAGWVNGVCKQCGVV